MKELKGLKVEAIAVKVPEGAENIKIIGEFPRLYYDIKPRGFDDGHRYVHLPNDEWKILGRANELNDFRMFKLVNGITLYRKEEWDDYCTANGLTNELILIKV